jgi:hypothetical protein
VAIRGTQNFSNGLYCFDMRTLIESLQVNGVDHLLDGKLWHHRLGHLNCQGLKVLFENQIATRLPTNLSTIEEVFCFLIKYIQCTSIL